MCRRRGRREERKEGGREGGKEGKREERKEGRREERKEGRGEAAEKKNNEYQCEYQYMYLCAERQEIWNNDHEDCSEEGGNDKAVNNDNQIVQPSIREKLDRADVMLHTPLYNHYVVWCT